MYICKTKSACVMCNVIFWQRQLMPLFFHLLVNTFAEPSGSHPTQGKAQDGNREPAL